MTPAAVRRVKNLKRSDSRGATNLQAPPPALTSLPRHAHPRKVPRRPHLAALTGLRFFAALHVVVYHEATSLLAPGAVRRFGQAGYIGVSLFFVLSGFVMAYTYLTPFDAPPVDRRSFRRARIARIYPAYVLALAVALPIFLPWASAKFAEHGISGPSKALVTAFANITLLQGWFPVTVPQWNAPGWSLSVEALFYALFPFIGVWMTRRSTRALVWVAGSLWITTLAVAAIYTTAHPALWWGGGPESPLRSLMVLKFFPPMHVSEFVMGITCALFYLRRPEVGDARRTGAALISVAATILVAYLLSSRQQLPYTLLHSGLLAPLFGVLIVALASDCGPIAAVLRTRILVFLGQASYSLYLLHEPLAALLYKFRWSPLIGMAQGPRFAIYLAAAIAISSAVFAWYEEPARRWLRRGAAAPRTTSRGEAPGVSQPATAEPQI